MSDLVAKFSSIARNAVWSTTADQIKALIEAGELPAETKLPSERILCDRLGISRVSLREALRVLESDGYVEVKAGRGTFVRPEASWTPRAPLEQWGEQHEELIEKLLQMRGLIEPGIAALAAENARPEDIAALRDVVDRLAGAAEGSAEAIALDADFHRQLAYSTRNSVVGDLIDYVMNATGQERSVTLAEPGGVGQAAIGHRAIVDAIARRNPNAAETAMRAHLRDARRYLDNARARRAPIAGRPAVTEERPAR
ncbi:MULTISPECIES: FadR/GntR family transcriptional regulator [unclassified Roseitalea]|uniref:FadR/GntR family transcriptional regulator n=1 Tax=unclassified Roseitalea TaxID=2639107 RepID=UPI00273E031E|nr:MULTISPECIES: FadR/GntR family transcriptional regulator [unclassified Roseitalea]